MYVLQIILLLLVFISLEKRTYHRIFNLHPLQTKLYSSSAGALHYCHKPFFSNYCWWVIVYKPLEASTLNFPDTLRTSPILHPTIISFNITTNGLKIIRHTSMHFKFCLFIRDSD